MFLRKVSFSVNEINRKRVSEVLICLNADINKKALPERKPQSAEVYLPVAGRKEPNAERGELCWVWRAVEATSLKQQQHFSVSAIATVLVNKNNVDITAIIINR